MNNKQRARKITTLKKEIRSWDKWLEISLSMNASNSFKESCMRSHKRRVAELESEIKTLEE